MANCLINTDFYGVRGVVIRKEPDKIIFENPGYSRTGKQQMRKGGVSDPRNKMLMKMFNLINIGERAGSGVPNIFNTWADQGWVDPIIEEEFDPDRTILVLTFAPKKKQKNKRRKTSDEKQAIKTSDEKQAIKTSDEKQVIKTTFRKSTAKTLKHMDKIRKYLSENGPSKTSDIALYIELSPQRTRSILNEMPDISYIGFNSNRKYFLK